MGVSRVIEAWTEYSRFFTALLVILDPFAAVPVFLALTARQSIAERRATARVTVLTVIAVLVVAALIGETLLTLMGTSLASFRVGGGLILLLMALALLQAQPDYMRSTPAEDEAAEARETVAIVPLAIPLLAGPGAISTVIIEMHRGSTPLHAVAVIGVIAVVGVLLLLVLQAAAPVARWLGDNGLKVLNRLFGLILTAIAVEIMANGLKALFPVLAG